MSDILLAIDQGTTSSRAMAFRPDGSVVARAQQEFAQHFPKDGWVEHDPEEIWETTLATARAALDMAGPVAAIGITNQRETTIVWERSTGRPVYPAIVWQDRRGSARCRELADQGLDRAIRERTGLLPDSYFSATKIEWVLDTVAGARNSAERGELLFGTVDCFLLWRLTGGAVHATDATNAARTMLFDIRRQLWDPELLEIFGIPEAMLPEVRDSAGGFGETAPGIFSTAIPVTGIAGDQQAATVGQACFAPGAIKSTYGTGAFILTNAGADLPDPAPGVLATVAYRLGGAPTYALEGAIFNAGTAMKWLRDGLGLVDDVEETAALASALPDNGGVYLVPAFTGLGAPWWDPDARGALYGLTRDTGPDHLIRAALESVAYQTADMLDAMAQERVPVLRVDGGMVANDWLLQFLADILDVPVERPVIQETTAFGAACLAGLGAGKITSLDAIGANWRLDRRFEPRMGAAARGSLLDRWRILLDRTRENRTE